MKKYFYAFCFVVTLFNMFSQSSWASFVMSNTACVGSTISVTANTGTNVATGYTWTALPSGSIISTPNNSVTVLTFTPAGTYTIMLSADDGSIIATDSKTIVAGPDLTSAGPINPICPPPTSQGPVNLYAYGANTYTWLPSASTGSVLNLWPYPSVSTTYTVTGTDINGCTSYTTQYVQVLPAPAIYLNYNNLVCDQDYVCIQEQGMDLVWWVWNGPCGWSQSGSSMACFTASLGCGGTFTVGGNNMQCMNYTTFSITVSACTGINYVEIKSYQFEISPNPVINQLNIKTNSSEKSNNEI